MAVARSRVLRVGTPHQAGCNMRRSRRSSGDAAAQRVLPNWLATLV